VHWLVGRRCVPFAAIIAYKLYGMLSMLFKGKLPLCHTTVLATGRVLAQGLLQCFSESCYAVLLGCWDIGLHFVLLQLFLQPLWSQSRQLWCLCDVTWHRYLTCGITPQSLQW
jgi:hypothetical protein